MKAIEIIVDEENSAEEFWAHVNTSGDAPEEVLDIAACNRIEVSADRAAEIRGWCEKAPGFSNGPEYAREALIFSEV